MTELLFWLSAIFLYYVYDGYFRLLKLILLFFGDAHRHNPDIQEWPPVSVVVTVFNEAGVIADRIQNIFEMDYPADKLEIMVACDAPNDGTDEIVLSYDDPRVRLFRAAGRQGKPQTQNEGVLRSTGEIIVLTDADTRFDRMFLKRIVPSFSDPKVGAAVGKLLFIQPTNSTISDSQGAYWNYELRLREAESRLGILVVASGACLAIRRELFVPVGPADADDCVIPLDVVQQGYTIIHAADALAYDRMDSDARAEFDTRVRMTLRNWQGTWIRPNLLNPLRYPGYAFALWSHKLLRWLSPVFVLIMIATAVILAFSGRQLFDYISAVLAVFFLAGAVGWIGDSRGLRIPVASTAFAFLLANVAFVVGLWRSLLGHRITVYR